MPSKTHKVLNAIKGHAYIDAPLQDYHTARAVMNAMRRRDDFNRLVAVRDALHKYRVHAWFDENGKIVLHVQGKAVLTL